MGAWFDDLPLDFTRADTRTAERALITGYDNAFSALKLVKDVGLNAAALNMMMPVKFLMREILNQARLANRLRVLLGEVFADPAQEAIHGVLRPTIAGYEAEITEAVRNRQPSLERLSLLPPTAEVWGAGQSEPRNRWPPPAWRRSSTTRPGSPTSGCSAAGWPRPRCAPHASRSAAGPTAPVSWSPTSCC